MRAVIGSVLAMMVATSSPAGSHKTAATPKAVATAAFCVAYVIRSPDERDRRPRTEEEVKLGLPGGTSSTLLQKKSVLDVAALASRVKAQAVLNADQTSRLTEAVLRGDRRHPMTLCYEPHHAFVFYSESGRPLCCIEVCFTCNEVRTSPQIRTTQSDGRVPFAEGADLIAIAKILDELGLPLVPYKTFRSLRAIKLQKIKEHEAYLRKTGALHEEPEGRKVKKQASEKR